MARLWEQAIMETKIFLSTPYGNDIDVKSGRVISNRNMGKLRQALELLAEVIDSSDGGKNKVNLVITGDDEALMGAKSFLEPVLDYYGVSIQQETKSLVIEDMDYLDEDAIDAISAVVKSVASGLDLKA